MISDWTVASLQKALKDRQVHFQCSDNKVKLFHKLMSVCYPSHNDHSGALPHDVTMQSENSCTQTAHRNQKRASTYQNKSPSLTSSFHRHGDSLPATSRPNSLPHPQSVFPRVHDAAACTFLLNVPQTARQGEPGTGMPALRFFPLTLFSHLLLQQLLAPGRLPFQ